MAGMISPASAAGGSYVALGDSYSAGVGTKAKVDSCYRSAYGYPKLVAASKGLTLSYQACSGARTADVTANQLGALSSGTNYVTMTIGGNDVGFGDVITECALPAWLSDCAGAINGGRAILTGALPGRYDSLFASIRSKAPNAKVAIGGYPLIFNGEDCNAATFFSPADESGINSATNDIDTLIRTKATARGFSFVDPRSSFNGHAVCDSTEWINGLSNPIEESYHPNRAGNVGYANLFGPVLTGAAIKVPALAPEKVSPQSKARAQADGVLQMNLTSPANLERARTAGLNPAEIKRLNAQLSSSDTQVVSGALAKLRQLDRKAESALR